jgi:hypothetical protein
VAADNILNGNTQGIAYPASLVTTTALPVPSDMETVLSTKASTITNETLLKKYEKKDFTFNVDFAHEH